MTIPNVILRNEKNIEEEIAPHRFFLHIAFWYIQLKVKVTAGSNVLKNTSLQSDTKGFPTSLHQIFTKFSYGVLGYEAKGPGHSRIYLHLSFLLSSLFLPNLVKSLHIPYNILRV